jgi:A-macroglobulin TED domain
VNSMRVEQVNRYTFDNGKLQAMQYLESQLPVIATDPYALSIVCYALTLANSTKAYMALQLLEALAVNEGKCKSFTKPQILN